MTKRKLKHKNNRGEFDPDTFNKIWNAWLVRNGFKPIILRLSAKRFK